MPVNLPSISATAEHHTVTLDDLRALVAAAEETPGDTIVRGKTIPFHMPDLLNGKGGRLMEIALDTHREGT